MIVFPFFLKTVLIKRGTKEDPGKLDSEKECCTLALSVATKWSKKEKVR